MKKPETFILVIFGASGDLTSRKLLPALYNLYIQQLLPEHFSVLGIGRTALDDDSFREKTRESLLKQIAGKACDESFLTRLCFLSINTSDSSHFGLLSEKLKEIDRTIEACGNFIYYLSTPPSMYATIAANLASNGLNLDTCSNGDKKLIIEKPFGTDLASARALNVQLLQYFKESQLYRIDHYLGKETVQNLIVTRFANGIFEPLWNRTFVEYVEVTSSESIGIENRGGYYDGAGAMRDMVQNHLLQLLGMVAMEPPVIIESDAIRGEILKVFQSLRPIAGEAIEKQVIRGQYMAATARGEKLCGYRDEPGVHHDSRIETFVAMKFYIDNWRWAGVPFFIRTGKRLPTRVTEIVIHFRPTPHHLFANQGAIGETRNILIIRIQPDEGILLKYGMKIPGAGFHVQDVNMDFHYSDLSNITLPEAYERLLLDCMLGDSTLYTRGDALEAAWGFIDPILQAWKEHPEMKMYGYPAGTWGPEMSDALMAEEGLTWRYPCKNLSDDGLYCEL